MSEEGGQAAPRLYLLKLRGANAVLLVGETLALVDAGFRGSAPKVLSFMRRLGHAPSDLSLILVTHYHPDHAGSVAELKRLTGARVAAHRLEAPYIRGERPALPPRNGHLLSRLLTFSLPLWRIPPAPVDILLEDGQVLDILDGLRVIHTPGHTPGAIVLYSQKHRFLVAGDTLNNRLGRLSLASHLFSLDYPQAMASAVKLAELDFDVLCCGHGPAIKEGASQRLRARLHR